MDALGKIQRKRVSPMFKRQARSFKFVDKRDAIFWKIINFHTRLFGADTLLQLQQLLNIKINFGFLL